MLQLWCCKRERQSNRGCLVLVFFVVGDLFGARSGVLFLNNESFESI